MSILRKLLSLWKQFAHVLGRIQTTLLLAIVYHVTVGPIGLIARLTGRDLLGLRHPDGSSFAVPLGNTSSVLERAQRQF